MVQLISELELESECKGIALGKGTEERDAFGVDADV